MIGPSGAGKSSLLLAVAGLERPTAGRIALDTEVWFDATRGVHLQPERRRIGYLPQDYGLFPHLTVAGNVRFAGKRDRPDLLERFGIAHLATARPRDLSGGERQRVALARAFARDPHLLLLDEPFGALDAITRSQVRNELADVLSEIRLPTLLVTHAFEETSALADRVAVLDQGNLVQIATPSELLHAPANVLVAALSGANILEGNATPHDSGSTIDVAGGGQLTSEHRASGPVQIAIHPWQLQLTVGSNGTFTDTVVSVHRDAGALIVRLTRVTVQVAADERCQPSIMQGATVGLRVDPHNVRILKAERSA